MKIEDRETPIDSVVVVIGANGFIGLETCQHFAWMHNIFDEKWPGKFESVAVANFEENGAFDEAFKGAAGVIYVSTPVNFHPDPAKVVDKTVKSTINTLEAAAEAGVRRYVLSSSSKAVETTRYDNTPRRLTAGMYNWDCLLKTTCGPRNDTFEWLLNVYSAGRTLAELSFWSWIGGNNPPFVANCVVPDGNFGRGLEGATSTNMMLKAALADEWSSVPMSLAFVTDVQNTARLLVAATAKSSLSNERIFAYYKRLTWDNLREKTREIRPELVKGDNQSLQGSYLSNAQEEINRAEQILKDIGRSGFTHEESMLQDFMNTCF